MKAMIMIWPIFLLLLACESELSQYQRFNDELERCKKETEQLASQFQRLQEMRDQSWQSTAKERFAHLRELVLDTDIQLLTEPYFVKIQFHQKKPLQYTTTMQINRQRPPTGQWVIYLLNAKGLILGISKKMSQGKDEFIEGLISLQEPLLDPEIPKYFRIEMFSDN